ncbi:MAG: universal stress protein [Bacteroidota bacterium]
MKKILVPTDFSAPAWVASDVAIDLAQKLSAEVHFYSRIYVHPQWDDLSDSARAEFPESFAQLHDLQEKFQELEARYQNKGVRIVTSYSHGDVPNVVSQYIKNENIYLVVMGSSGADGLKELLFGSNAQKIVNQANCPVMVIKHPPKDLTFKHLVFASDFHNSSIDAFEWLIDFGTSFGSHIHLLAVESANASPYTVMGLKKRMANFEKRCWRLPCTSHVFGDVNVELGIRHYAQDNQCDLITLVTTGKSPLQKLMEGSISERLVNHVEMPILTLHAQKKQVEDHKLAS